MTVSVEKGDWLHVEICNDYNSWFVLSDRNDNVAIFRAATTNLCVRLKGYDMRLRECDSNDILQRFTGAFVTREEENTSKLILAREQEETPPRIGSCTEIMYAAFRVTGYRIKLDHVCSSTNILFFILPIGNKISTTGNHDAIVVDKTDNVYPPPISYEALVPKFLTQPQNLFSQLKVPERISPTSKVISGATMILYASI
jgi:hypothetical protein